MQRTIIWMIGALVTLLVVLPAHAQKAPDFVYVDETDTLEREPIEQASQSIITRYDATIAIYRVVQGGEADFQQRLQADGLLNNDDNPWQRMIAIYVTPQQAFMRFDAQWDTALLVNDRYATILQEHLAPQLAAGNATQGIIDTLAAVERALDEPTVTDHDPANIFIWSVVVGLVLLTGVFVGYSIWQKQQTR